MVVTHPRYFHETQKVFCALEAVQGKKYEEIVTAFRNKYHDAVPPFRETPPSKMETITRWIKNLRSRGTFVDYRKGHSGRPTSVVTPENIERVRQEMDANFNNSPEQGGPSLRRNGLDIKRMSRWRILRLHLKYNPYIVRRHQKVSEQHKVRRLAMCNWLVNRGDRWYKNVAVSD